MQIVRRIRPGESIPRLWGYAWHELNRKEIVIMRIPLNYLANWVRAFVHFLDYGIVVRNTKRDLVYAKAIEIADRRIQSEGVARENVGYQKGVIEAVEAIMRVLKHGDNTQITEIRAKMGTKP